MWKRREVLVAVLASGCAGTFAGHTWPPNAVVLHGPDAARPWFLQMMIPVMRTSISDGDAAPEKYWEISLPEQLVEDAISLDWARGCRERLAAGSEKCYLELVSGGAVQLTWWADDGPVLYVRPAYTTPMFAVDGARPSGN